ncbi:MAG: amidohydrolase [Bacteroidales bacterium]|nr:amidohydrolase [Bacteroidales bacterium]
MFIFAFLALKDLISKEQIKEKAKLISNDLLKIRRHIHAYPELSFLEEKTAAYIAEHLKKWNISYHDNVAGHGIVGYIKGKNPDKKLVALRADIDALPIVEQNDIPYKSLNPGVMHACGHDVHTTCLMGAVHIINELKDNFEGTVQFIFQPAEEKLPGGAIKMIEAGVLDHPRPDSMLGQHVYPDLEVGKVGFRKGMYMASADEITLTVRGKGGHAAMPDKIDDTVLSAAEIIVALQKIVSRKAYPAIPSVLSFGRIQADGATNVIPSEVIIQGTFRTFDEEWRKKAHRLITEMAELTARANGTECDVFIDKGYPFLENDADVTEAAIQSAREYLGEENVVELPLRMTAEDFASYAQVVPACFYRLGTGNVAKGIWAGLHHPNFNVDEDSIEIGTGLMVWNALMQLKR